MGKTEQNADRQKKGKNPKHNYIMIFILLCLVVGAIAVFWNELEQLLLSDFGTVANSAPGLIS